jgi:hypothetical protein
MPDREEDEQHQSEEQDWRELCERASRETDPKTLLLLIDQINCALERREQRLRQALQRKPEEPVPPDS